MVIVSAFFSSFALTGLIAGLAMLILSRYRNTDQPVRALVFLVIFCLSWRYMYWRITETLPNTGETRDMVAGIVFLALECGTIFSSSLAFLILSRTRDRKAEATEHLAWWGDNPPRVDIIIATYNEEETILERTIIGALASPYPKLRVWVLDDGRRLWLQSLCARLGAHYNIRPDNKHAKAGNINAYLVRLEHDPEAPEFISVLDADFIPHVDFVPRMLALFHDPGVGLVQSPQHFFNPDPIQHNLGIGSAYPDEQRFFFDHLQPARDAWSIAFCCGTSSMMRYAGLRAIGGFPTSSVTEDFLITLCMRDHGYATVYLNEPLTEGLAPEGLGEYISQRGRWCLGMMQIVRGAMGPFARNHLRLIDRLSLLDSMLFWTTTYPFRIACLITPLLYWLFGITVVNASLPGVIEHFLPYYVAVLIGLNWVSGGLIVPIMNDVSQLLGAYEISKAVFIGLTKPHGHKFKVTVKGGDRTKIIVQWPVMRPLVLIFLVTLGGMLYFPLATGTLEHDPGDGKSVILFWTFYNLTVLAVAMAVCIELPRDDLAAEFGSEPTTVHTTKGVVVPAWLTSLSTTTARLRGGPIPLMGELYGLRVDGVGALMAHVTAVHDDGFTVGLTVDSTQRAQILAKLHTRSGAHGLLKTSLFQMATGLFGRMFRGA